MTRKLILKISSPGSTLWSFSFFFSSSETCRPCLSKGSLSVFTCQFFYRPSGIPSDPCFSVHDHDRKPYIIRDSCICSIQIRTFIKQPLFLCRHLIPFRIIAACHYPGKNVGQFRVQKILRQPGDRVPVLRSFQSQIPFCSSSTLTGYAADDMQSADFPNIYQHFSRKMPVFLFCFFQVKDIIIKYVGFGDM